MIYDRIIIHGDVSSPFQHIYVYKDGEKVDTIGVQLDDVAETVLSYLEKYELDCIELSGAIMYMQGIEKIIKDAVTTKYSGKDFTFRYV